MIETDRIAYYLASERGPCSDTVEAVNIIRDIKPRMIPKSLMSELERSGEAASIQFRDGRWHLRVPSAGASLSSNTLESLMREADAMLSSNKAVTVSEDRAHD